MMCSFSSAAIWRNKLQGQIIDALLFMSAAVLAVTVVTNPNSIVNACSYAIRFAAGPLKICLPSSITDALNL